MDANSAVKTVPWGMMVVMSAPWACYRLIFVNRTVETVITHEDLFGVNRASMAMAAYVGVARCDLMAMPTTIWTSFGFDSGSDKSKSADCNGK